MGLDPDVELPFHAGPPRAPHCGPAIRLLKNRTQIPRERRIIKLGGQEAALTVRDDLGDVGMAGRDDR